MKKVEKSPSAEIEVESSTNAQVEHVSKPIAKPNVVRSLPCWKLNVFVKIKGQTFVCEDCGSNMFSKSTKGDKKFKCQGCGLIYQGQ